MNHQEIVEPLLVFCCHGIRVRDTRCCSMILRLFISLVPEFSAEPPGAKKAQQAISDRVGSGMKGFLTDTTPVTAEIAQVLREYISTEILQACITSFHEPYFVDLQKDLASLIASTIVYYSPITATPANVLLSLPDVKKTDLERLGSYASKPGSHTRQQRAIVLDMLKDLKGVSVSEMGKLPKSTGFGNSSRGKRPPRSKMAQAFLEAPVSSSAGYAPGSQPNGAREATPEALEGVSNLFDA